MRGETREANSRTTKQTKESLVILLTRDVKGTWSKELLPQKNFNPFRN